MKAPEELENENSERESDTESLEQQLETAKNAHLTVLADFQNYKRRVQEQQSILKVEATDELLMRLTGIIDDYLRSQQDKKSKTEAKLKGLQLVFEKLEAVLEESGLEKISVKPGDKFESETMEAITTAPVSKKKQENTVIEVTSEGYRHTSTGRILKTAKVITGKFK
ncbi:MAG: nucleotide exchange factor GrpE [Candidatus Dojkabacteria bacterium]